MTIAAPYLLFLGHGDNPLSIKTARGIAEWRPELCVGEYGAPLTLGLRKLSPKDAVAAGAKTFVIGLTNTTGDISEKWRDSILDAIEAGMNVVSGLHQRLSAVECIDAAAKAKGVTLHDVRHVDQPLPIGTGAPRHGRRILTVGTDCSVGKMYTSLAIEKSMRAAGFDVTFRATGQTGILISGDGLPVDAVVADFIAGGVEALCPSADDSHWDVIEGQGSIFNPAYAGVSLGLLHGAQADILVMCHEVGREQIKDKPGYAIPSLEDCVATNLQLAQLTNSKVRLGAISLNCRMLDKSEVDRTCQAVGARFGVPCFDPLIHGPDEFINDLASEAELV